MGPATTDTTSAIPAYRKPRQRWIFEEPHPQEADALAKAARLPHVVAELLINPAREIQCDALATLLSGYRVTTMREGTEKIDVIARATAEERRDLGGLGNLVLLSRNGIPVPLSQIAHTTATQSTTFPAVAAAPTPSACGPTRRATRKEVTSERKPATPASSADQKASRFIAVPIRGPRAPAARQRPAAT